MLAGTIVGNGWVSAQLRRQWKVFRELASGRLDGQLLDVPQIPPLPEIVTIAGLGRLDRPVRGREGPRMPTLFASVRADQAFAHGGDFGTIRPDFATATIRDSAERMLAEWRHVLEGLLSQEWDAGELPFKDH